MAIKTFTTGEVLTAADTNTYLANSGLVYVTSGALSTATTNFAGCFTTTYDNYKVVISSASISGAGDIYLRYLTTGTTPSVGSNYYWAYRGLTNAGASADSSAAGNAYGYLGWSASGSGGAGGVSVDILAPFLSVVTMTAGSASCISGGTYTTRQGTIAWDASTVFTGLQVTSSGAATLSGNVTIYGYRKG